MEGEGQPEDSELSEPGEEAEFSEEEGPQAAGEQRAVAVARPTDLEPAPCDKYMARCTHEDDQSNPYVGSWPCCFSMKKTFEV